jgi:Flp pilus assembly protein TadG
VTNLFATQKQSLKRFLGADEGQALVLTALALVVLMLMAGLGVDVGYLRYQKQQMQKAADAGALAGATALAYNGAWKAAAVADVNANGFTTTMSDGTSTGVQITVDKPWEGPFAGQAGYVEVSVTQPQPTFFMKVILPPDQNTVAVRSWAVASALAPPPMCIYSMDPASPDTFDVRGNVGIGSACGIAINSSDTRALDKRGGSGTVEASYIGIVGGCKASGGVCAPPEVVSDLSSGQLPVTGIAKFTDPLLNVAEPPPPAGCKPFPSGTTVIFPDTYCGISISGSSTYTFQPGLYKLLGGGFNVTGSATLNGTGVTFYNTFDGSHPYAGVNFGGSVTANLSAPTDSSAGGIPGMLFFQNRLVPTGSPQSSSFGGSNAQTLVGAIYFPSTLVTYNGTPSLSTVSTIMVGWQLEFRGNVTISNYTFLPGGGGPIHSASLAE